MSKVIKLTFDHKVGQSVGYFKEPNTPDDNFIVPWKRLATKYRDVVKIDEVVREVGLLQLPGLVSVRPANFSWNQREGET